jgi:hypothetical protein
VAEAIGAGLKFDRNTLLVRSEEARPCPQQVVRQLLADEGWQDPRVQNRSGYRLRSMKLCATGM